MLPKKVNPDWWNFQFILLSIFGDFRHSLALFTSIKSHSIHLFIYQINSNTIGRLDTASV